MQFIPSCATALPGILGKSLHLSIPPSPPPARSAETPGPAVLGLLPPAWLGQGDLRGFGVPAEGSPWLVPTTHASGLPCYPREKTGQPFTVE